MMCILWSNCPTLLRHTSSNYRNTGCSSDTTVYVALVYILITNRLGTTKPKDRLVGGRRLLYRVMRDVCVCVCVCACVCFFLCVCMCLSNVCSVCTCVFYKNR